MAKLTIRDGKYFIGEQELAPGMAIRRYDDVAGGWFEGNVGIVRVYNHESGQYVPHLHLIVEGYAPSPFRDGDEIEVSSTDSSQF